ncbi:unnamed protein product [Bursaphelenchus xylophilus]|uniref:(pine wood nematode) hypothetical protein n=1 Tax=Bursaphelenchus xylophilus TaxID=6326 RepID=A0A1I7RZE1_BURXY|nr:unnamed protein product [Bursaphelenchus xylophilus]CAG9106532.1 unnamed protein product [Bursaphelenchus xylophilus]
MVAVEMVVQINKALNIVSSTLLVFAICYTSAFLYFLFRTSLIHGNLKFVMTCTLIENHLLQFCRFLNTDYLDPSSNNFFDRFACRATNCVFSVCYLATIFSVITIGGERLIASLNIRNYERFSNSLGQGYVCTLILVGTIFGLVTTDRGLNPQQKTCIFAMEHTVVYGQLICTMMVVSLFGWGMQIIVYRWNLKMLKDKAVPLSMRYQVNENIIVLRLLFPVMIFYFVTTAAATVIVLKSFVSETDDSPEQKARDLFISNILKLTGQCSTLTFMFSFVCRHPGFKAAFVCTTRRRICEEKRRVISQESWAHNETNVYFQELRKNWEQAKNP